jgi:hypothetical protein
VSYRSPRRVENDVTRHRQAIHEDADELLRETDIVLAELRGKRRRAAVFEP